MIQRFNRRFIGKLNSNQKLATSAIQLEGFGLQDIAMEKKVVKWFIPLRPSRLRPSRIRPIAPIFLVKTRYYVSIFIQYPESILSIGI